jgi:hypothetical protein
MMPKCEPYMSSSKTTTEPFVKQEKSIKQQEQIDLYQAYFEIHKRAMEIDEIVSKIAAYKVFSERQTK